MTTEQTQHPTKAEWDAIAAQLDSQFKTVFLRCDGFLISAALTRISKTRLAIAVAVNGWQMRGAWLSASRGGVEMTEEPRRFYQPTKRQCMSRKELARFERLIGKRECKKRGYYEPFILPVPYWSRPRPFIAHLRKHNQRIEILDYETYQREIDALRNAEGRPDV